MPQTRPRPTRFVPAVVAVLAAGAIVAGCGGSGARNAPETAEIVIKATSNTARFSADQTVPRTTLAAGLAELDQAITQGFELRSALSRIYNSGDPIGQSMVIAFCTGVGQVAAGPEDATPPSSAEWEMFLIDQVRTVFPTSDFNLVAGRVGAFMTAVDLSAISPGLAVRYFQACR